LEVPVGLVMNNNTCPNLIITHISYQSCYLTTKEQMISRFLRWSTYGTKILHTFYFFISHNWLACYKINVL